MSLPPSLTPPPLALFLLCAAAVADAVLGGFTEIHSTSVSKINLYFESNEIEAPILKISSKY
ncbi:MAG: hypothetical protein EBU66_14445 [Bacteroidetes bacterium]|nr:hypothetical protein [bacterium]NBP65847.1 hypothetical protein [Bacteroidota bacterium]